MAESEAREASLKPVLHTRVVKGAGGGPEKTILNSCGFLESRGYRAACAYLRDPHDPGFEALVARADQRGVDLRPIDDRGPLDWRIPSRMRQTLGSFGPVIWHGHDYKSNLLGLILRRAYPMSLVTTVHGWVQHTWKTPLYYAIDRWCLRRYDSVICVSQDLYETCIDQGVSANRCVLVPNGVELVDGGEGANRERVRSELGVEDGRLVIGAVGRLSGEKGFENLIQAFDKLSESFANAELWIAGEGPLEASLRTTVQGLGSRHQIKMLGYRSDVQDLFQAMDLFVLSSLREGLPNVVLEAMASGVPVLATRVAGIPDLIENGVNGFTVEAGSVDSLLSGLRLLTGDRSLRQRVGVEGRRTVEESFSFDKRMDTIQQIYDETLSYRSDRAHGLAS